MTTNEAEIPAAAVSAPDADAPAQSEESRDAIQEGKERAKAVMAASGIEVSGAKPTENGEVADAESPASSSKERLPNGRSSSTGRKRSRSGSRKPSIPPVDEKGERKIETDVDKYRLLRNIERDDIFNALIASQTLQQFELRDNRMAVVKELNELWVARQQQRVPPAALFGPGYQGYGNGTTEVRVLPGRGPPLVYPAHRKKPGNRRARRFHTSRNDMGNQADQAEELVPVRLDIEHDKIKLRDTFTWNLHDRVTPPDIFAETLVEDFKVPPEHAGYVTQHIIQKLTEQITDYYPHVYIQDEPLDDMLPYFAYKNDEMRILIKLNITIGPHTLIDQFEWDINNPMNSPEEFARQMAGDLSLSGEFTTAIAHQIREQSQMFTRSLYITSHPFDGRPIEDTDISSSFLPSPIPSAFRPVQSAKDYTPYLYELSEIDLQREELSLLRDQRRQKRSVTRRGGPALPDLKDRERTVRSLVVSSVLPGAAETIDEARVFKLSRSSGRTRRAGRVDGGDDSDESESEESEIEETVPVITTSSRGRVIRGAATAAQQAMRQSQQVGRSATPEVTQVHHEPRSTSRRHPLEREESVAESTTTLIVKLKLPKDIFRQWAANPNKFRLDKSRLSASRSNTPQQTPNRLSMGPPQSPALSTKAQSGAGGTPGPIESGGWSYDEDGKVEAPNPIPPGTKPPNPPPVLLANLASLRQRYPNDNFEAIMKATAIDGKTGEVIKNEQLAAAGGKLPEGARYQYQPRIKCNDCPGKLYTAGAGQTVDNFEVHLKNRLHKERVEARRKSDK